MAKNPDDIWVEADGPEPAKIRRHIYIGYFALASVTRPSMRPAILKAMIDMVRREAKKADDVDRAAWAMELYEAADELAGDCDVR